MNLDDYESFHTDTGAVFIHKDEVVHSTSYIPKPIPPKGAQNGTESFKLGIRWDLIAINCNLLTKGDL